MPQGELQKLVITTDVDGAEPITVLFNPTSYSIESSNKWEEQERSERGPELQYTGSALKTLSMELFFDSYENGEDVRQYTRQIANLLTVDSNNNRPPVCAIQWGGNSSQPPSHADFPFVGVLESLSQQFVLFNNDGTPVRATLSVSFKEFLLPEDEERQILRRQSFPAKTYVVVQGDTLSGIAAQLWKQPQEWRRIAEANDIEKPRQLIPGQVFIIPSIED